MAIACDKWRLQDYGNGDTTVITVHSLFTDNNMVYIMFRLIRSCKDRLIIYLGHNL